MDYPAQNANAPLKGSRESQDALKAAMSASLSSQPALLGNLPSLEINKEVAEQIGQNIKDSMGEEANVAFDFAIDMMKDMMEDEQSLGNTD